MDPASIIGTTSAILSFIQFAGKVISTAIEIRDNAGQATNSNQVLRETLKEFNSRLATLRLQTPILRQNPAGLSAIDDDAQISLLGCSTRCEDLGSNIEALFCKIGGLGSGFNRKSAKRFMFWKSPLSTPSNDPSNLETRRSYSLTLKAIFKTLWFEKDIKTLREQWEQCVRDFNFSFMRLDMQTRLQSLQQVSDTNSTTLDALQKGIQTLVMDCKDANLKALGLFLEDFNKQNSTASKEKHNREFVLNSLKFTGMDARRDQVKDAARETFEWLLEEDSIPIGHDDLDISLKEWLSAGNGVFHITGKPGSGKSTLMKLIGESYESNQHLQEWAGQKQKRLVTANFFTWKAADSNQLQNKVEGMIRTLLHQILTDEPGLIARVFPKHWDPEKFHPNSTIKETKLHWTEIHEASELVFGSADILGDYCVFLLIDGMDEFDDDREAHFQTAKRIREWCERFPHNVKACVSSREDSPFMNTFSVPQRLRLHLVTFEDIRRLTEQRLMEHHHFASSSFTDAQREELIHFISSKAEGVFLWVVLTIVELTHPLDAGEDFEALHEVVRVSNKNLNKFIEEMISRIPQTYLKDAQILFRIVKFATRHTFAMDLFHVHRAVTHAKVKDCSAECVDRATSYEEAIDEVKRFKSRLPVVSRGLLELRGFSSRSRVCVLAGSHARFRVSFIHRSVFDFFEENDIWSEGLTDNASEILAFIVASCAHVADALPWEQPWFFGEPPRHPVRHWRALIERILNCLDELRVDRTTMESHFVHLKALDAALLRKKGVLPEHMQLDSSQWSDVTLPGHRLDGVASAFLTAYRTFGKKDSFCGQFVSWAVKGGYPDWVLHPAYKAWVMQDCFRIDREAWRWLHFPSTWIHPDFLGVNEALDASILPASIMFSSVLSGSPWLNYLIYIITLVGSYQLGFGPELEESYEPFPFNIVRGLSKFLALGVEPEITFHWWPESINTDRKDSDPLREGAGSDRSVESSTSLSPNVAENSLDDNAWEDSETIHFDELPRDGQPQMTESAKDIPSDAEYGLGITVGTGAAIQLSAGLQYWQRPKVSDTLLMRFLLFNFGATTGSASQADILKVICSLLSDTSVTSNWGPRWKSMPEDVVQALETIIITSPELSKNPVDFNYQQRPDAFAPINTPAQDCTVTGPNQAGKFHILAFETVLRDFRMIILSVLVPLLSILVWYASTSLGFL